MAAPRRRSGYKYTESASFRHPEIQHPPQGYCLIEADLHRATTSLAVESFPFLSQLKLRSAINLSAEPLHRKANEFFRTEGVTMLSPRSLESFDGPYDLWEEAAKESLELLLDADNHPMILLDSNAECESACLVGCLRRLQHWSMVAIHDEYHMMTMRATRYSTSQRFIERFDLDLVTLATQANLPRWYRNHLDMLEEERIAEAELYRRDPDRPTRAWTHGVLNPPSPPRPDNKEADHETTHETQRESAPATATQESTQNDQNEKAVSRDKGQPQPQSQSQSDNQSLVDGSSSGKPVCGTHTHTEEGILHAPRHDEMVEGGVDGQGLKGLNGRAAEKRTGEENEKENENEEEKEKEKEIGREAVGGEVMADKGRGVVPDFRLNGFVYVCPLISEGCKFTAKAWLQDEDD